MPCADDRYSHAVFLDAGIEIGCQGRVFADVDIHGQGGRVEHFKVGVAFMVLLLLVREVGVSGGLR